MIVSESIPPSANILSLIGPLKSYVHTVSCLWCITVCTTAFIEGLCCLTSVQTFLELFLEGVIRSILLPIKRVVLKLKLTDTVFSCYFSKMLWLGMLTIIVLGSIGFFHTSIVEMDIGNTNAEAPELKSHIRSHVSPIWSDSVTILTGHILNLVSHYCIIITTKLAKLLW